MFSEKVRSCLGCTVKGSIEYLGRGSDRILKESWGCPSERGTGSKG